MLRRLKGGGRRRRRLLILISKEGGEDHVSLLPFIFLVFAVLLRHCLVCDPNSPNTAAALPRETPPQPFPSAATAKAPKSLLAHAVPSAAVSAAPPSVGASSRRVGVIRWRGFCRPGGGVIGLQSPLLRAQTSPTGVGQGPPSLRKSTPPLPFVLQWLQHRNTRRRRRR